MFSIKGIAHKEICYIFSNIRSNKYAYDSNEPKLVKKYQAGDTFGELALLYNAPKAASITADSDEVITWVLDRETFDHIVKEASTEKREENENS